MVYQRQVSDSDLIMSVGKKRGCVATCFHLHLLRYEPRGIGRNKSKILGRSTYREYVRENCDQRYAGTARAGNQRSSTSISIIRL